MGLRRATIVFGSPRYIYDDLEPGVRSELDGPVRGRSTLLKLDGFKSQNWTVRRPSIYSLWTVKFKLLWTVPFNRSSLFLLTYLISSLVSSRIVIKAVCIDSFFDLSETAKYCRTRFFKYSFEAGDESLSSVSNFSFQTIVSVFDSTNFS